jgi:threonine/homoserine/homoserine lactone efflux protein
MLIEKILLGITLSAPIGPVSLEMIKRGLNRGFSAAFTIRLGAVMGNILCLLASYFGISALANSDETLALFTLAGASVLVYMGIKSIFDKRSLELRIDNEPPVYRTLNGLMTGFILALANPIAIVFWLSIFAGTIDTSKETTSWIGFLQNFSIIAGVLIWGFFLSSLLEIAKRLFNEKFLRLISKIAGAVLIWFGLKFGYKAIILLMA